MVSAKTLLRTRSRIDCWSTMVYIRVYCTTLWTWAVARLGWPSLHRCWRSHWFPGPCQGCTREIPALLRPPTTTDNLSSLSRLSLASYFPFFADSTPRHLCSSSTPHTSRVRRIAPWVIIEPIISSTRVISGGIYIVHHFVVFPISCAKESF